jgi:hypothetical protein
MLDELEKNRLRYLWFVGAVDGQQCWIAGEAGQTIQRGPFNSVEN